MGKVMSIVSRRVNRFNVENRAHRVLERDKPVPAPKYESNLRDLERALEADPALAEKMNTKDVELNSRLKSVYVTSNDSFIDYRAINEAKTVGERALPINRKTPEDFEYGHQEPRRVRPGRCTLRQAMQFISDHQSDTEVWTPKKIADEYKLKEDDVVSVLKYFKTFQVFVPNPGLPEKILKQPQPQPQKQLPKNKEEKNST